MNVDISLIKEKLDKFIEKNYKEVTYGFSTLVNYKGSVIYEKAMGNIPELDFAYRNDTIYDLASLTKPIVTATLTAMALEEGLISLEDQIGSISKRFMNLRIGKLTVRSLLTHTSGLPSHYPLYSIGSTEEAYIRGIEALYDIQSTQYPREIYSDLNYILLGFLLEDIHDERLDKLAESKIFRRLDMNNTSYNPQVDKFRIAPTEKTKDRGLIWGKVHDENAYYLGGVAGHAGLFSNIYDLNNFMSNLINYKVVKKSTFKLMTHNWNKNIGGIFGFGWMIRNRAITNPSPAYSYSLFMGDYVTYEKTIGHTGFTGTSIVADLRKEIIVILLTNRVYPTRENDKILRFRRLYHNIIFSEF